MNDLIHKISTYLQSRGVQLSESKTKVTHISKDFDFIVLGLNLLPSFTTKRKPKWDFMDESIPTFEEMPPPPKL